MAPPWSSLLKMLIDGDRFMSLRLAEHDPIRAAEIESQLTLTEIAECVAVRAHDNYVPEDEKEG